MKLKTISWPVYKLGSKAPSTAEGVLFYIRSIKGVQTIYIVDDTTIKGDTLGLRRLQLSLDKEVRLHKLKHAYYFLGDLIKVSNPNIYFIDSTGKVFKYTKTKFVPLIYRKITNIIKITGGVLIEADRLPGRYMALYPPMNTQKYIGLLKISNNSYIIYNYADIPIKDTLRKI